MHFLKLAIISFIALFLLVTCIGLLLPSTVRVSRTIEINAPADSVYPYISDLKNWPKWINSIEENKLEAIRKDTNGRVTEAVNESERINILSSNKNLITTIWKGTNGKFQKSNFTIIQDQPSYPVVLNWVFDEHIQWYPWEKIGALMNEEVLGPAMEKDLENLKQLVEKN